MSNEYNALINNIETHKVSFLLNELHDSYYELFHTETADEFADVGMKIEDIIDKLLEDCVIGSIQPAKTLLESIRSLIDDVCDAHIDQVWLIKVETYFYLLNKQIAFLDI